MKTKLILKLIALCLLPAAYCLPAFAQGTAFTYQGQLQNNGSPASGTYNLEFSLFNANTGGTAVAGPVTTNDVVVTNGLFTVLIDFGPGVFTGETNWLQIGVETNGVNTFTTLAPRQELTPTPYAIDAENANNLPGLLVQQNTEGAPNLIGGSPVNFVSSGVVGATIGGGGVTNYFGIGLVFSNSVTANFGTVGGGAANTAGSVATVAGGNANTASGDAATVGGGQINTASGPYATVGGGYANTASGTGSFVGGGGYDGSTTSGNSAVGNASVVGGGLGNNIPSGGVYAFIGGGQQNTASGGEAMVGGGYDNTASGPVATVGGGQQNTASTYYATVSGGVGNVASAFNATVGGGELNTASGQYAAVGGGEFNNASTYYATVGGGEYNTNSGNYATVGGGQGNTILANSTDATISGGYKNIIVESASFSTIGGGEGNAVYLDGATNSTIAGGNGNIVLDSSAFIGGGEQNYIYPGGTYATIPGGSFNTASGSNSFAAGQNASANDNGSFVWSDGAFVSSFGPNTFTAHASGGFQFELASSTVAISASGTLSVPVLTITGGSDVAEPFAMSSAAIPKGSVVIIDEEHPGHLKIGDQPYDTRVAGIVSGANGVNPGISLHQVNVLNGDQNVALSGRVYVLADTSNGSIHPGDLLTTSVTPGDAMKVTDHARAEGAILGKAMTSLSEGKGMVLVLVTLQ